ATPLTVSTSPVLADPSATALPVAVSRTVRVGTIRPSLPSGLLPTINRRLSGKKATCTTGPRPRHTNASRLAEESQTLTVWSELAEASRLPVGSKTTQV